MLREILELDEAGGEADIREQLKQDGEDEHEAGEPEIAWREQVCQEDRRRHSRDLSGELSGSLPEHAAAHMEAECRTLGPAAVRRLGLLRVRRCERLRFHGLVAHVWGSEL